MRLVATEYISLDGVFEEPGHWSFPYFDDKAAQFKLEELNAADAQLLGRVTYEGLREGVADDGGTGDFGVKMNTMPKYVVTSTLKQLDWAGSSVSTATSKEVRKLKAQPGRDLLLAGSGQLFRALSRAGLIDLYRFMVHPVILGGGKRLFTEDAAKQELKLIDTKTFGNGIVVLELERA